MVYVCFDIGGTLIKHAVYSEAGEQLTSDAFQTPLDTKENFYKSLIEQIQTYETSYNIKGIGISMPGFIDVETGKALTAGALYELYDEFILEEIQKGLDRIYPMAMENDANCAALAEQMSGHAQDVKDFLLITIGTGIGGAIVLNGELHRGNTYRAGEFGQMHINVATDPYRTSHEYAATSSLVLAYKAYKQLAEDAYVDARNIITEMAEDEGVKAVFDRWIAHLAAVIFNTSTFFNPQRILLGGGISANPVLIPAIEAELAKDPNWEHMRCELVVCKYFNEAGLRGALGLIQQVLANLENREGY